MARKIAGKGVTAKWGGEGRVERVGDTGEKVERGGVEHSGKKSKSIQ